MEKIKGDILSGVADTLFITLLMRKLDIDKGTNILNDKFAAELVNKIDYPFERYTGQNTMSFYGCLERVKYMDEQARDFIQTHKNPIVVSGGCGLDTRYQRLREGNNAQFYEIDLPEVIALRRELLEEDEREHFMAADLTKDLWLKDLKAKHPKGNFIFIVEGVIQYFQKEEVENFFKNIAEFMPDSTLVLDFSSTFVTKHSKQHDMVKRSKTSFGYGIDDSRVVEKYDPKIKFQKEVYIMNLMKKHKLSIRLLALIPVMRKSSRIATFYISDK